MNRMASIIHHDRRPGARRHARQPGFSLIELVLFIVIVGILAVGLMSAFSGALLGSDKPEQLTRATQLAQERMELILAQRRVLGFAGFTAATFDPCTSAPASTLPPCTGLPAGYNLAATVTPDWNGDTNYKVITVTVSGAANTQLSSMIADY